MNYKTKSANILFVTLLLVFTLLFGAHEVLSAGNYGKASWIGERFQGKKTASGELFDMNDLTASHATLPFGSKVKVTSKKTGKSVVVRVNNRSEIDNGRVIDLSKRAAEQIGLIQEGVGYVTLEVLSSNQATTAQNNSTINIDSTKDTMTTMASNSKGAAKGYVIQYGSFFDLDNSIEFRDALKQKKIDTTIKTVQSASGKSVYRVNSAKQFASRIEARNELAIVAPQEGVIVPVDLGYKPDTASKETSPNVQKASNKTSTPKAVSAQGNTIYEYGAQFGAFATLENARTMQNNLLVQKGIRTIIHQFPDDARKLFRVLTNSPFASEGEANGFLEKNKVEGVILTFVK